MNQQFSKKETEDVWARFRTGDKVAFAILYNLHIDNLYSYGKKLCKDEEAIKDSLQELFLELFLKRDKINISPENLKFYLTLALRRSLVKKIQSGRRLIHGFNDTVDFEPQYSVEFQIIEQENDAEINMKVISALNQLPAKQKEAVYLRFNESLEYDEIAKILEITIESVRKQVHRALKTVRVIIGKKSGTFLFVLFSKKK